MKSYNAMIKCGNVAVNLYNIKAKNERLAKKEAKIRYEALGYKTIYHLIQVKEIKED
jgi:hypothetical protein